MAKRYKGVNRRGSVIELTKGKLRQFWKWSKKPYVIHNPDEVNLVNETWGISKSEARRNPGSLKYYKKYSEYDFFVITYGNKGYPNVPTICLLNEELFNLAKGTYKPQGVDIFFFDLVDFINGLGNFREVG